MMNPIEEVIQLARDAEVKLNESFNAPDVLPFAAAAISIIESHPLLQGEFEAAFLVMPSYAPSEFVEVCTHALRWPNLKLEFESRCGAAVKRNDWRVEPVYRHYLEAFEPDWEDATDFYASYFSDRSKR